MHNRETWWKRGCDEGTLPKSVAATFARSKEEKGLGGLGGCVVEDKFDSAGRGVWVLRGRGGVEKRPISVLGPERHVFQTNEYESTQRHSPVL